MEHYITRQKGQRPFRARARVSVLPGDPLFYFLFYDQRNRRGNARFTYENRERRLTRIYRMKPVISGF
jgi:hypothetical protein